MTPENAEKQLYLPHRLFDGGRMRVVYGPTKELKSSLQEANKQISQLLEFNPEFRSLYQARVIHGFVKDRSFRTHVACHRSAGTVLALDLYHAFETVTESQAISALESLGASEELINFLFRSAFIKGVLPAGFPTSPNIFNAVLLPMDEELSQFAKDKNWKYSRYADDLAFSTPKDVHRLPQEEIDEIRRLIGEHGFDVHKLRIGHPWSKPVELCGTSLFQDRITVPNKKLSRLRGNIHRHLFKGHDQPEAALSRLAHIRYVKGNLPEDLRKYEKLSKSLIAEKTKRQKKLSL